MKILIITHFYPPLNRMASSRPASWAELAEQHGHDVTVLTTKKYPSHGPLSLESPNTNGELMEIDFPLSSLFGCGGRNIVFKLIFQIQKLLWVFRVALMLLFRRSLNHDVVISTFNPVSTLYLGWLFAITRRRAIWVADYRDLWTDNTYKKQSGPVRMACVAIQKLLLSRANLITTVSTSLQASLQTLAPHKPVRVIYNGFKTRASNQDPHSDEGPVSIVYTGTIYTGKRNPEPLLKVIRRLIDQRKIDSTQIRLHFLGDRLGDLAVHLDRYQLNEITSCPGQVTRSQSIISQQQASLLLMLGSNDPGILTGKLFEYLDANRPILSLGDTLESAVGQLLYETKSGVAVGTDDQQIESVVLELVSRQPLSFFDPCEEAIENYSRASQGQLLIQEIERLHDRNETLGNSTGELN